MSKKLNQTELEDSLQLAVALKPLLEAGVRKLAPEKRAALRSALLRAKATGDTAVLRRECEKHSEFAAVWQAVTEKLQSLPQAEGLLLVAGLLVEILTLPPRDKAA